MTLSKAVAATSSDVGWRFDNTYARLPKAFHSPATPVAVREPRVCVLNEKLALELGLDFASITPAAAASILSGQQLPEGAEAIAQAYAGHQFGGFTMLGDGRAILLGEHRTPAGELVDIQLKGAGRTRFSRGGDGLAALGPMLREYIISEAMAALGIPTTRSLAVVTTGEPVYRESIRQGAILTRVAKSHIRVGTFEYAARLGEAAIRELADYAIVRHDPGLSGHPQKYIEFFRSVADRQAALVTRWQLVGFIHGVMNTDNMAISGETIDYGPCAFMNRYHPETVFSSIDRGGRYAYGNQPHIAQWNLARFAETLLPLFDPDPQQAVSIAMQILDDFPRVFEAFWLAGMRKKLGLLTEQADDAQLVQSLLDWMEKNRKDFTNTFRNLSEGQSPAAECERDDEFEAWHSQWQSRIDAAGRSAALAMMQSVNPAVIPRNHLVEEALSAVEEGDLGVMHRLLDVLTNPFESHDDAREFRAPPDDDAGYRTFCGT
jgi:uncharacterized protein YdiU (UPF0061 family)